MESQFKYGTVDKPSRCIRCGTISGMELSKGYPTCIDNNNKHYINHSFV
jgi:hypothetical protein